MFKQLVLILLATASLATANPVQATQVQPVQSNPTETVIQEPNYMPVILDSATMTYDDIHDAIIHRNGKLITIIDHCTITEIDDTTQSVGARNKSNGWYNMDDLYNYVKIGDEVTAYCTYNPDTNYEDDVIDEYHIIVK